MEQIKIDIVPAGISPVAHASQFDTSRQIRFNLFNQGAAYTLTGAETVTMVVNGEEESITNTSDNYVIWDVAEEDCETSGVIACELRIVLGSMLIGSKNFFLEVEMDPYDGKNLRIVTVGPADICTFETDLAEPFVSVKSAIVASGGYEGTPHAIVGYTGLNLTACGVNLLDLGAWLTSIGVAYTESNGAYTFNAVASLFNNTFTFSDTDIDITIRCKSIGGTATVPRMQILDSTNTIVGQVKADNLTVSCRGCKFNIDYSLGGTIIVDNPLIYDDTNVTTYPVTWTSEGTVYGGEIDLTTGVLTVTYGEVDLGDLDYTMPVSNTFVCLGSSLPSAGYPVVAGGAVPVKCENYATTASGRYASNYEDKTCGLSIGGTQVIIKDTAYSDKDTFKAGVAGVKLIYELATPYTVQLSATQVRAVAGVNNVFGDTGETEVKYLTEG